MALNDDLNKNAPNMPVASGGGSGMNTPLPQSSKVGTNKNDDIDEKLNEKNIAKHATAEVGKQIGSKAAHAFAMQGLAKMAMQGLLNVASGIKGMFGGILGALSGFVSGVSGVVTTITSFLGFGITGAPAIFIGMVSLIMGSAFGVAVLFTALDNPATKDFYVDCGPAAKDASDSYEGATVNVNEAMINSAKQVYAVLHEYGIPDINIAGALGNIQQESSVDPTKIEGCYSESYYVGERKKSIIANPNAYCLNTLFPAYERARISLRKNYYKWPSTGEYWPAVGFFQYTGPECEDYFKFCAANGGTWSDIKFQMAYALNGFHRDKWLRAWTKPERSVGDAATAFAKYFEGAGHVASYPARRKYAEQWYARMVDWENEYDSEFAKSVLDLANTGVNGAELDTVFRGTKDCLKEQKYNNSSIATAALEFAWEHVSDSKGSKGTELWKKLHDLILPDDNVYQSCDRTVCVAVRWAGADDNFPSGNADTQFDYMQQSDKWQEVDYHGLSDLKPGDIVCEIAQSGKRAGECTHVIVYTGNELAKKKFPRTAGTTGNAVSGSYHYKNPDAGRSPAMVSMNYKKKQRVFRNVKKEANSRFKNIAASLGGIRNNASGSGGDGGSNIDDGGSLYH